MGTGYFTLKTGTGGNAGVRNFVAVESGGRSSIREADLDSILVASLAAAAAPLVAIRRGLVLEVC